MVDDFQNPGVFHPFRRLGLFVVIHQNQLLAPGSQQIPAGNHAFVFAVPVQHREIPMALAGHDFLNLIDDVGFLESNQIFRLHKIADGHTLVDQAGRGIRVVGRGDHRAAPLLGQLLYGHGHRRPFADHNAGRLHLNGAQLRLVAVPQNHQVVPADVIFHKVWIGRRDQYLAFVKISTGVPDHQLPLQRLHNIGILGVGLGQDAAVIHIHIRLGNIAYSNQSLQHLVFRHRRQRHHTGVLHGVPGLFQGNVPVDALGLPDLDIPHLCLDMAHQFRLRNLKIAQHKLRFLVDLPGSAGHVVLSGQLPLQGRVANS